MGDNNNLFTFSESAINAIKKPGLVQKIIVLKGKVIMDSDISNLCNQIPKLNDTITQLHSTNKKIRSELAVAKNVNTKLEEQIINLEKNQAKYDQYSVIILNQLVFQMIYQKIIWRTFWSIFATILVWKLNQKTLKFAIVHQLLDIAGTLKKELQ